MPKTKIRFTEDEAAVIFNERLIGHMTFRQLARKHNCNRPSIRKAIRRLANAKERPTI